MERVATVILKEARLHTTRRQSQHAHCNQAVPLTSLWLCCMLTVPRGRIRLCQTIAPHLRGRMQPHDTSHCEAASHRCRGQSRKHAAATVATADQVAPPSRFDNPRCDAAVQTDVEKITTCRPCGTVVTARGCSENDGKMSSRQI